MILLPLIGAVLIAGSIEVPGDYSVKISNRKRFAVGMALMVIYLVYQTYITYK
jgi:phosphate uptake regulator